MELISLIIKNFGGILDIYSARWKQNKYLGDFLLYIGYKFIGDRRMRKYKNKFPAECRKYIAASADDVENILNKGAIRSLTIFFPAKERSPALGAFGQLRKLYLIGAGINIAEVLLSCSAETREKLRELMIYRGGSASITKYFDIIETFSGLRRLYLVVQYYSCDEARKRFGDRMEVIARNRLYKNDFHEEPRIVKDLVNTIFTKGDHRLLYREGSNILNTRAAKWTFSTKCGTIDHLPLLSLTHLQELYLCDIDFHGDLFAGYLKVLSFENSNLRGNINFRQIKTFYIKNCGYGVSLFGEYIEKLHILGGDLTSKSIEKGNTIINEVYTCECISNIFAAPIGIGNLIKTTLAPLSKGHSNKYNTLFDGLHKSGLIPSADRYIDRIKKKWGFSHTLGKLEKTYFYTCFLRDPVTEMKKFIQD